MTILTKQAIERLKSSTLRVALFNGCFNKVVAVAQFSRYRIELTVNVTHPLLVWQCGDKNSVELVYWKGCTGSFIEIPEELTDLINQMREIGTMPDLVAKNLSEKNAAIFLNSMEMLGIN